MSNDDDPLALAAAKELVELLQHQLDHFGAEAITLTREQAIVVLAIVEAAAAQIERELGGEALL